VTLLLIDEDRMDAPVPDQAKQEASRILKGRPARVIMSEVCTAMDHDDRGRSRELVAKITKGLWKHYDPGEWLDLINTAESAY
jgi:hypothetical protein